MATTSTLFKLVSVTVLSGSLQLLVMRVEEAHDIRKMLQRHARKNADLFMTFVV
jgi:hypothetical protein